MTIEEELAHDASLLLGEPTSPVGLLHRGGNNVLAKIRVGGSRDAVVKRYFRHADDPRDRLATEFSVLSFLWDAGLRCIPEPLTRDDAAAVAVYSFLEGEALVPGAVDAAEGARLGEFLVWLWDLRTTPGAHALPDVSEAAFSVRSYCDLLQRRLLRLETSAPEIRRLLADEIRPGAEHVMAAAEALARRVGVPLADESEPAGRTLSQGDIGFHNALRRSDGTLAFVDFEYGGWDEPANVIASACLPPAVPLPPRYHLDVLGRLIEQFDGGPELAARVRVIYPLLAVKWSLILLNEFIEVGRERRSFAGALPSNFATAQIAKSRELLEIARASAERDSFLEALTVGPRRTGR